MSAPHPIPAIQQYMRHLTQPVQNLARVAAAAEFTQFVYQFNNSDLTYSSPQYPVSGVFGATTSPWFNDIATIPSNWQWTAADNASAALRTDQVNSENAFIQANVPGQSYSGTASEIIQQRYTLGMWDTSIVFSQFQIDTLTQNWVNDDAEFARQRLGAANPDVIAKYRGDNDSLAAWVNASSGSLDKTALIDALQTANAVGSLFVCDYQPILSNVITRQFVQNGSYFAAPTAFFNVVNNKLLPLAIQLDADNGGYIFTPQDDANSWLLAKLWVASADAQWWYSGTHLFNTHSVVMVFATAALNLLEQGLLTEDHPILVLLYPHIQKVFNINSAVYNIAATEPSQYGIYQTGSFCDQFLPTGRIGIYQIINNLYSKYQFDAAAFDQTLAARGVDSENLTISFPYRDDGQVWWQAIQTFVGNIVDATYADDAAVAADTQLNAWMGLVQEAFNHDGTTRYTWAATKAYLKQSATNLFFMGSAQHTAVNDSMFQSWGFLPNGAFAMTSAPPTGPGVSDDEVLAALPDPQTISEDNYAWPIQNQINFVMNGTAPVTDLAAGDGTESSLHTIYPYDSGSSQYQAVTAFYHTLWTGDTSVQAQITASQNQRITNYQQANPLVTTVPNSVSYYYLSVVAEAAMGINAPVMNCIQI